MRVYNKTVNYSLFQKDLKMDFVTFIWQTNIIHLFTRHNFFSHGFLSIEEMSIIAKQTPFYSLFTNNRPMLLKNLIFFTNIAKELKVDDTNFLLDYKRLAYPSFTPKDSNEFKFDIEHTFIFLRY